MPYRVDLVRRYYHPRTGKLLSDLKAKAYNKRAKKKIQPQVWLVARHVMPADTRGISEHYQKLFKRQAGRIAYQARLTQEEKILPASAFRSRRVFETLGRKRVFSKLYDDFEAPSGKDVQRRGAMRITVSGHAQGRRIKEVFHLPFHRMIWEGRFANQQRAYAEFKRWIVASVLTNLKRRGLRISNPKESQGRIEGLRHDRMMQQQLLEVEMKPKERAKILQRIDWHSKEIARQKKTRQLTQATIRIEKLI